MQSLMRHPAVASMAGCSLLRSQVGFITPLCFEILQERGRKRALKKPLSKAERAERRRKREEKEAARKQYSFMERIKIRRMKSLLSPSQQFPGRLIREDEAKLPDRPLTDVYIRGMVKTQFFSIRDALSFHRQIQQPAIFNNMKAPVRLRMELNMNTEKATKMVANSDEIVAVPHIFEHKEKRSILAFVRDPKLQELAVECGAEIALGQDAVKKIIKGHFRTEDYDFCVAHVDMAPYILPLRGVLKTRFPTRTNGALGDDLPKLIEMFKNGIRVNIRGDPVYPLWGLCDTVVGRLTMADEEIEENIEAVIKAVCRHRNPALGPFINRALMMVIPGDAHFAIDIDKFVPAPTEEEIEKLEKRRSKKEKTEAAASTTSSPVN